VLQTLAESPFLDVSDLDGFREEARRAIAVQRGWFAVILLRPDGQQAMNSAVAQGEPLPHGTDLDSLNAVVHTRRPAVGAVAPGTQSSRLQFPIRVPVERNGQLQYVLTAVTDVEILAPLVKSHLPETEEWTRVIIDSGLHIAARSRRAEQYIGRAVTPAGAELVRHPPTRPIPARSLEGESVYSVLSRTEYGWASSITVPLVVLDGPVRASILAIVAGSAVLLVGGLFGVLVVSRRVARDFVAARDAAAALADGRTPTPSRPRVAEAQQVEDSLQRAAQLLQERARDRDLQLQLAKEAQARAEEASRTKDKFLAVLGHELRNPLAPALTALELMKLRGGSMLQREREVLERQVSHMTRLVDDLLDVSRLTRGKVELLLRRFETGAVVDRALDMAGPLFKQHGHHVTVDVPTTGLLLEADEDRILQVLVNLLTNAAKYTPADGHIVIVAHEDGASIALACQDNGPGIPEDLVATVFEPFAQGPRAIDRQQGGLGLGLALARSLTELHGGTLTFEPVMPHGSRFTIRLPRAAAAVPATTRTDPSTTVHTTPRRILLVEDNEDGRTMLKDALEEAGHTVQPVADGLSALAIAATFDPEAAILDIGLPGMDGYQLARALRAQFPSLLLIALTGYGQDSDATAARDAGFDTHCTKPITIGQLLAEIETLSTHHVRA
jgi:signal transduction histidine kinase/ActR/RegA family two-component response regulator